MGQKQAHSGPGAIPVIPGQGPGHRAVRAEGRGLALFGEVQESHSQGVRFVQGLNPEYACIRQGHGGHCRHRKQQMQGA